jgi:rod shape-determining protein MreC
VKGHSSHFHFFKTPYSSTKETVHIMRFSWWQLGALSVALAGLAFWQNASSSRGGMAAPDAASSAILSPFQRALGATGDYFLDIGRVVIRRDDLASRNARLERRVADLEGQNARLERLRRENQELRRLLKMPKLPGGRNIAAEVVFSDAGEMTRRLVLNVGSRAGVRPKDVVTSPEGLVGQVTQVGPWTCAVTLPIDRDGAVGAIVARSGAKGVVLGDGNSITKLSYLDFGADVREGDLVVTSGLVRGRGAVFPRGIVIGRVVKIEKNAAYSRQEAFVEPAVPFNRLSSVSVRVEAGE